MQAAEQGRPPERTSMFYAKGALQYLVPILLVTLTKQASLLCCTPESFSISYSNICLK